MAALQAILGIGAVLAVATLLSRARRKISWKVVGIALTGQAATGALFLHVDWAKQFLVYVTVFANSIAAATKKATAFVFGYVGNAELPFEQVPGTSTFIFAFQVLPVIMVIGALSAMLWHWRVLGSIVAVGAWLARKTLGVSSPVGFAAVANAFLGMIEAPLLIKPYLSRISSSELFAVMAVGMSTIAGGTAVIISGIMHTDPAAFANLVTATLMNVPGALALSLMLFPAINGDTRSDEVVSIETPYRSTMDALVAGTADGVKIFVNVVSLLIVFVTLVALIDGLLGLFPGELSLARILGYVLSPVAWLMGIPQAEVLDGASILGTKVAVNELVAYSALAESYGQLTDRTHFILTFALCGFGNLGSLAIMIGGVSAMAPERRDEIIRFGMWALLVAFMTNCLTAAIASLLYW
ncbi:MAG: nucleoside:proton symporter [Gammaproteobacteria bacterium]|nr:nucleoside:proton symporter [Gammaproteobacteria bacterium]